MALTLFGAALGAYESKERAEAHVLDVGLASLADRWTLRDGATGEDEVVCIAEVQLASGEWALFR